MEYRKDITKLKGYQSIVNIINDSKHNRVANDYYVYTTMVNKLAFDRNYGGSRKKKPAFQNIPHIYESLKYHKLTDSRNITIQRKGYSVNEAPIVYAKYYKDKGYYNPHTDEYFHDKEKYLDSLDIYAKEYYQECYRKLDGGVKIEQSSGRRKVSRSNTLVDDIVSKDDTETQFNTILSDMINDKLYDKVANDNYIVHQAVHNMFCLFRAVEEKYLMPHRKTMESVYHSLGYREESKVFGVTIRGEDGLPTIMYFDIYVKDDPNKGYYNPHNQQHYFDLDKYFDSLMEHVKEYYEKIFATFQQTCLNKGILAPSYSEVRAKIKKAYKVSLEKYKAPPEESTNGKATPRLYDRRTALDKYKTNLQVMIKDKIFSIIANDSYILDNAAVEVNVIENYKTGFIWEPEYRDKELLYEGLGYSKIISKSSSDGKEEASIWAKHYPELGYYNPNIDQYFSDVDSYIKSMREDVMEFYDNRWNIFRKSSFNEGLKPLTRREYFKDLEKFKDDLDKKERLFFQGNDNQTVTINEGV